MIWKRASVAPHEASVAMSSSVVGRSGSMQPRSGRLAATMTGAAPPRNDDADFVGNDDAASPQ